MPPKKPKNNKKPDTGTRFSRCFRLFILTLLVFSVIASVGSFLMRQQVIRRLKTLAITSSSLVLSRPFAITRDINFERVRITDRLDRLGYRRVNSKPERPGQYFAASGEALIFLREAQLGPGARQDEMLVRAVLDSQGMIKDLQTVPGKHALPSVWLEPEILSLLGTSSTRAQIAKVLPDFSPLLVKAVLATEDERFYLHFGVDPVAIVRAALLNITAGRIVQGGSTITQQLAKNLFLSSERSLLRKVREALAAVFIETAFTKEQILTLYLNQVFLGQEGKVAIHGFGEASRTFFDKDVADLSLAEAATLAGMVKAPTKYSPRRYPDRAAERRLVVLERMREAGVITEREAQNAAAEKLHVKTGQRNRRTAPYFVDYVRQQVNTLLENSDSAEGPLHVLTGIDPEAQKCANTAVRLGLRKLEAANPRLGRGKSALQAALIAVYPATGEIAAWVGGRDYGKNQFDRVSMAKRQPGSAFKPFVYLTALAGELNNYRVARTTNTLLDEPLTINIPGSGSWSPQNYDEEFRGEVTLRQALAQSLNVPTVRLAMKVGINHVARTAALFGFGEALPAVPSLALGAGEVTPMELARAYAAIANGGLLMDLRPVTSILQPGARDALYQAPLSEQRVVSEQAAFVLTDLLTTVIERGTGQSVRRLGFSGPAAGKTGTTNDTKDAWFAGFTPRLLAVIWVGFDDNRQTKLTGSQGAVPIWTEFMKCAAVMEPELKFVPPTGIVYRKIDQTSGLLDQGYCPNESVVSEIFIEGTEPITPCDRHGPGASFIDRILPPSEPDEPHPAAQRDTHRRARRPAPGPTKSFWETFFDW